MSEFANNGEYRRKNKHKVAKKVSAFFMGAGLLAVAVNAIDGNELGAVASVEVCAGAMDQAFATGSDVHLRKYSDEFVDYYASVDGVDINGICNDTLRQLALNCNANAFYRAESGHTRLDLDGELAAQQLYPQNPQALNDLGAAACVLELTSQKSRSILQSNVPVNDVLHSSALHTGQVLYNISTGRNVRRFRGHWGPVTDDYVTIDNNAPAEVWDSLPWPTAQSV